MQVIPHSDNQFQCDARNSDNVRDNLTERIDTINTVHSEINALAIETASHCSSTNSVNSSNTTQVKGCGKKVLKCSIL